MDIQRLRDACNVIGEALEEAGVNDVHVYRVEPVGGFPTYKADTDVGSGAKTTCPSRAGGMALSLFGAVVDALDGALKTKSERTP